MDEHICLFSVNIDEVISFKKILRKIELLIIISRNVEIFRNYILIILLVTASGSTDNCSNIVL